jgi:hypothetical protein
MANSKVSIIAHTNKSTKGDVENHADASTADVPLAEQQRKRCITYRTCRSSTQPDIDAHSVVHVMTAEYAHGVAYIVPLQADGAHVLVEADRVIGDVAVRVDLEGNDRETVYSLLGRAAAAQEAE